MRKCRIEALLHLIYLYIKRGNVSVRTYTYVRNGGRGQLISDWRHNKNDFTMTIAGLCRYGDWRRGHRLHRSSLSEQRHTHLTHPYPIYFLSCRSPNPPSVIFVRNFYWQTHIRNVQHTFIFDKYYSCTSIDKIFIHSRCKVLETLPKVSKV